LGSTGGLPTLARDRVGEPERGLKALEQVLALQPDNQQVARQLLPIYREQWRLGPRAGDLRGPARQLRRRRRPPRHHRGDAGRRVAEAQRPARRRCTGRGAPTRSARRRGAAGRPRVGGRAGRRLGRAEQVLRGAGAAPDCDNAERLELLDKLAGIARERLGRPQGRTALLRKIIELEPTNRAAMARSRRSTPPPSSGRPRDRLQHPPRRHHDPGPASPRAAPLGVLQEQQVGDLDAAIETYKQIQAAVPATSRRWTA
jgi:hypothetical protein